MKILIIHQNFPGQFRQLVPYLLSKGHELTAIYSHERDTGLGINAWRYKAPSDPPVPMSLGQHLWYQGIPRAEAVAHICTQLISRNWIPDRIIAHSGWGETLGLSEVFPSIPKIIWPELWMRPEHGGHGLDPTLQPPSIKQSIEQLGRNSMTQLALETASSWILPTRHQADSLTKFKNKRLHIIHEGIDATIAKPFPQVSYVVRGITIDRSVPTLTFVNRNLERLRGFDVFMRALPSIMRSRPDLRVIIIGDSETGYGHPHPSGRPIREVLLEELHGSLDHSRIHFLGRIPYDQLIAVLQASWIHVYLSYPFVLGWSLLEAMACGCPIVGSVGMPVEEVITDGVNGHLIPMDRPDILASKVSSLLSNEPLRQSFSLESRKTALKYDQSITLPLIHDVIVNSVPLDQ